MHLESNNNKTSSKDNNNSNSKDHDEIFTMLLVVRIESNYS